MLNYLVKVGDYFINIQNANKKHTPDLVTFVTDEGEVVLIIENEKVDFILVADNAYSVALSERKKDNVIDIVC